MRRFGVIMTATLLALSLAPGAAADGPKDFVAGGGKHLANGAGPTVIVFDVSAHTDSAAGGPAHGSMSLKGLGVDAKPWKADVTCLAFYGSKAFVTGVMTSPAEMAGMPVVLNVVDRGVPGSWTAPDSVRFSWDWDYQYQYLFPAAWVGGPAGCLLTWGGYYGDDTVPLTSGNIVVHDAP